jgi:hypothetical protein
MSVHWDSVSVLETVPNPVARASYISMTSASISPGSGIRKKSLYDKFGDTVAFGDIGIDVQ